MLVPPAPLAMLSEAASLWRQAPLGCLGPWKAAVVPPWRRALGCLVPGCLMPVKAALAAPWWQ